jgi:prepilin-type N-terminal cleavage/methylation domain-containing protein
VKKASHAFTLIEIMVVVMLVGMMATIGLPKLFHRSPALEWRVILEDFNNLIFFARQEAISNQKLYRLALKSNPKGLDFILVEEEKDDPEKPGRKIHERDYSPYVTTKYELSEQVRISAVYYGKTEMMAENKATGYCYVISDGLVQDVIVHLIRNYEGVESKASFRMMPFLGAFEYLDETIWFYVD